MTAMQIVRAVVEQALEALEHHGGNLPWNAFVEVRKDLRAALAQQAEPLNLRDPAVQKRLATQWGYVPAAQAEPVGEILLNWSTEQERIVGTWAYLNDLGTNLPVGTKLYTAPPQRKPLTDEKVCDLWSWAMTAEAERTATTQQHAFARAIERAHGIKNE